MVAGGQGWSKIAIVAVALGALLAGSLGSVPDAVAGSVPARPNIVVIQTDDQTVEQMRVMERTRALLGERGATFENHYANWPLCCPSRATQLTGQYAHNHGVLGNSPPNGGFQAFDNSNTIALWLQDRGYTTAHVGKFLNGYGDVVPDGVDPVPPGWDEWYTADGSIQTVYSYTQNENGVLVEYGAEVEDFKQDVYTDRAEQLISEHIGSGDPLYLQLDYTAPHGGGPDPLPHPPGDCEGSAKPAARHATAFDAEPLPEDASFNEADVTDKPLAIQVLPLLDAVEIENLTRRYRCRTESLLSVDEGVAEVVAALRAERALRKTYVIFTSDNGFFTGEHRVANGKVRVYEPASAVPLIVRGPGVPEGVTPNDLTVNADLAATVLDLSGAQPTLTIDGRSLLPAAERPWIERGREVLIETRQYEAIHTQRYVWVEYRSGETELYDLREDPQQLLSLHDDPAYRPVRRRLVTRLAPLRRCAGFSCRTRPALDLELDGKRGRRGCTKPPVRARVEGSDERHVDVLRFLAGSKTVATDRRRPFRERLSRRELGGGGPVVIRVRASFIDGRRIGWERELRVCR